MARKPNYGFEKRQRELAKQKKKEEKRLRKLADVQDTTQGVNSEESSGSQD